MACPLTSEAPVLSAQPPPSRARTRRATRPRAPPTSRICRQQYSAQQLPRSSPLQVSRRHILAALFPGMRGWVRRRGRLFGNEGSWPRVAAGRSLCPAASRHLAARLSQMSSVPSASLPEARPQVPGVVALYCLRHQQEAIVAEEFVAVVCSGFAE